MRKKKENGASGSVRFLLEGVVMHAVMVSYRRFTKIIPEHAHGENVYEIHYVTEGVGEVSLNRQRYQLTPGTLYITGPGILHEQLADEVNPVTEFGLYLQTEGEHKGGELLQIMREHPLWCGTGRDGLRALMEQILSEQAGNLPGSAEKRVHLLAEFVIECIRSIGLKDEKNSELPVPEEEFSTNPVREETMLLVADEIFLYEYRDITLEGMAKRLGLSVRQTQRFLERMYGKSFTRKKLEARMSAAVPMLQNGRYTITEISERLGYSSPDHFSHAFSGYYGYVPSSLRKK